MSLPLLLALAVQAPFLLVSELLEGSDNCRQLGARLHFSRIEGEACVLHTIVWIETPDNEDDLEDSDTEDEDEEPVPLQGLRAAEASFYKALRAKAVAEATKRVPARTSRNGQVLAWLETREAPLPSLAEIGSRIVLQRGMMRISRAPTNFIAKIPARYRRFRREAFGEGKWYSALPGGADVDPLELDLVILAMLRAARRIAGNAPLMRRLGERTPAILNDAVRLQRNQILVDEATDFSPLQLSAISERVCRPGIEGAFGGQGSGAGSADPRQLYVPQ